MSERHTVLRSMRDLGLAAWFGGSLMGSVGLDGATRKLADPHDKALARVGGWTAWAPLNVAAAATHVMGAIGLLAARRRRPGTSSGVTGTLATLLTVGALGSNVYSAQLGRRLSQQGVMTEGDGDRAASGVTPQAIQAKRQLRVLQWVTPALTGGVVVLTAQQAERGGTCHRS